MSTSNLTSIDNATNTPVNQAKTHYTQADLNDAIQESFGNPPTLRLPTPASDWNPFHSSLFDTVRVIVNLKHKPLAEVAAGNPHMKCKGYFWSVQCPDTGAVATVISKLLARDQLSPV